MILMLQIQRILDTIPLSANFIIFEIIVHNPTYPQSKKNIITWPHCRAISFDWNTSLMALSGLLFCKILAKLNSNMLGDIDLRSSN